MSPTRRQHHRDPDGRTLNRTVDGFDRHFNQTTRRASYDKIKIDSGAAFLYPMPRSGGAVSTQSEFMAAAWLQKSRTAINLYFVHSLLSLLFDLKCLSNPSTVLFRVLPILDLDDVAFGVGDILKGQ